ncbi:MAG: anti-sigma factor [Acidobacteriota bacterium]|jgi:hypothetical protein
MSTHLDHEALQELCAGHALGSLDPGDAVLLEEHLQEGCAECRDSLASFRAAVDGLGAASPPVTPPEGALDRILERVAAPGKPAARVPRTASTWRWALPLAASLVAVAGWMAWEEHGRALRLETEKAGLQAIVDAKPSAVRVYELAPTEVASSAEGYLYLDTNDPADASDDQWKLYVDHLPPVPDVTTYKAWLVTDKGTLPLGSLEPEADGHGFAVGPVPPFDGEATVQLTLEQDGEVPSPRGPVILQDQRPKLRRPVLRTAPPDRR